MNDTLRSLATIVTVLGQIRGWEVRRYVLDKYLLDESMYCYVVNSLAVLIKPDMTYSQVKGLVNIIERSVA